MVGEISSMEFDEDEDEVVMTMTISKDMPLKISALNKLKNTLKRTMMGNWAKSESGIELMKEIAKADSKITLVMQTEDTNENIRIKVSKDDANSNNVAKRKCLIHFNPNLCRAQLLIVLFVYEYSKLDVTLS